MNYAGIVLIGGIAIMAAFLYLGMGADIKEMLGLSDASDAAQEGTPNDLQPTLPEIPLPPTFLTPPQPDCPDGSIASGVWQYDQAGNKIGFIKWECVPMVNRKTPGGYLISQ